MDIISMPAKQLLALGNNIRYEDDVNDFLTKSQFYEILGLLKDAKETRKLLVDFYSPEFEQLHRSRSLKIYRNKDEFEYLSKRFVWKVKYSDLPLNYIVCSVSCIFEMYRAEYLVKHHLIKNNVDMSEFQVLIKHFHNFIGRTAALHALQMVEK